MREVLNPEQIISNYDNNNSNAQLQQNIVDNQEIKFKLLEQYQRKQLIDQRKQNNAATFLCYQRLSMVFQLIVSIYACVTYIVTLYQNPIGQTLRAIEFSVGIAIIADLINGLLLTPSKKKYFLSVLNILDLIIVIPLIVHFFIQYNLFYNLAYTKIWRFIRFMRFFRIYKLLKIINIHEIISISENKFKSKVFAIYIEYMGLVFLSAAIILTLNTSWPETFAISVSTGAPFTFEMSVYFVLITLTTIGYGDIVPSSTLSRICIGLFFIAAVVYFTMQLLELSDLMKEGRGYKKSFKDKSSRHVILTAECFNELILLRFLREFYHRDHNLTKDMRVVMISQIKPTLEIQKIISMYEKQTFLIEGSIFNEETLKKVNIKEAEAAFILSNQYEDCSIKADSFSMLASKMMREYNQNMQINVQLINKDYLIHSWCNWDNAYSIDQIKLGIIATNAYNPGFCPLILNLMRSSGLIFSSNFSGLWYVEYAHGLQYEIYCIQIPQWYVTTSFESLVKIGFNQIGLLIFGIKRIKTNCPFGLYEILLNPVNYKIQMGDEAIMLAIDLPHAQKLKSESNYKDSQAILDKNDIFTNKYQPIGQYPMYYGEQSTQSQLLHTRSLEQYKFVKNFDFTQVETLKYQDDHVQMWKDECSQLENHILVFGNIESLPTLIDTLRNFSSNYICYVSDKPQLDQWKKIKHQYTNILYCETLHYNKNEFLKLGILRCKHVILLKCKFEISKNPDLGVFQIYRIIEESFPDIQFTIELVDENNLKYLNGIRITEIKENLPFNCHPKYASGLVFFNTHLDSILAQAFFNRTFFDIIDKLLFQGLSDNTSENCKLNMIYIDNQIGGKITFGELFQICINNINGIVIPIGIYRKQKSLILGNELPYIITYPDKQFLLFEGDKVFVLGDTPQIREARTFQHKMYTQYQKDLNMSTVSIQLQNLDDDTLLDLIKEELNKTKQEIQHLEKDSKSFCSYYFE